MGREALRAADGSAREPAAGSAAGNADARAEASGAFGSRPSAASAASDVSDSDAFPAFERDFRRDVSDGSRSAAGLASPFGHGGKSPSWHQKLSMAARAAAGVASVCARERRERLESRRRRRRGRARLGFASVQLVAGYHGVASFGAKHRRRDEARRHRARAASADVRERRRAFVYERLFRRRTPRRRRRARAREFRRFVTRRVGSRRRRRRRRHVDPRGTVASASQEARRRRAVPTSRAFARSREHFGGRSSSPAGARGTTAATTTTTNCSGSARTRPSTAGWTRRSGWRAAASRRSARDAIGARARGSAAVRQPQARLVHRDVSERRGALLPDAAPADAHGDGGGHAREGADLGLRNRAEAARLRRGPPREAHRIRGGS